MADFNMSKLWLGKDGYYRDVNGNKIAQKGQPISGAAWRYLAGKYGREVANRTSMNTRNGNIFQNGRWRFNDVKSSKQGKTATWDEAASRIEENAKAAGARKTATGYIQRNPFNNKDTYLNQDTKNKAMKAYRARQKSQTSAEDPDEFSWSDLNPFKKGAWEGNWDSAAKNFVDSFKSIPDIWKKGYARRGEMYDNVPQSVLGPKRNTGALARFNDTLGDISRTGNAVLGGTIGTALQLLLPQKVEREAGNLGQYLDLGKDVNSVRSYLTPGEEGILPDDPRNKGFADQNFAWTGLDEQQRRNINDDANFAMAILGTKGMKGGVSRLKTGVSGMVRDGVGTTLKNSWKPIMSHTPGAANLYQAGSALNSVRRALAPKRLGGAEGIGSRSANVGKAAFQGLMASDPTMALYPYAHSSYMVNLSNNN